MNVECQKTAKMTYYGTFFDGFAGLLILIKYTPQFSSYPATSEAFYTVFLMQIAFKMLFAFFITYFAFIHTSLPDFSLIFDHKTYFFVIFAIFSLHFIHKKPCRSKPNRAFIGV